MSEELFESCMNGDINNIKGLIEKGAKINIKNNSGETPLDIATDLGLYAIADLLE